MIHEDLQGGELAISGGPVVGVVAVRVLLVRVGALLEENAGALDVAPQAAVVERRPAILVAPSLMSAFRDWSLPFSAASCSSDCSI